MDFKMKNKSILKPALFALFALTAVSCKNELTPQPVQPNDSTYVALAKAPEFVAWSGDQNIVPTRSYSVTRGYSMQTRTTDAAVGSNYFKVVDYENADRNWLQSTYPELARYIDNAPQKTDRGESVSQHEFDIVMDYLVNHPDEGSLICNMENYFIQNVGYSNDEYTLEYLQDNGSVHHSQSTKGHEHMDYLTIGDTHMSDFNATDGKRSLVLGVPTVNPTYHDSYGDLENTKTSAYRFYYIEVDGVMNCYLCFDYQTKKYDNGMCDYQGDKVFTDWVIKLVPADGSPVQVPGNNTEDEFCDTCGHPEHNEGECPECNENEGPCYEDDTTVVVPGPEDEDAVVNHNDEVEINLSINDVHTNYDVLDLVSKLSIHIRKGTDVKVRIPVPMEYVIAADDLAILQKHREDLIVNGGPESVTYNINGTQVSLFCQFDETGITVWTEGVTQELIDYLFEHNGDGLNFEIYNYFNKGNAELEYGDDPTSYPALTKEELKYYLDQATVEFLDEYPQYYINAFGWEWNSGEHSEGKNPWDCTVSPVNGPQIGPKMSWHLNGTPYNYIYSLDGSYDDHHDLTEE